MILEAMALILHDRLAKSPVRRPEWAKLSWAELPESRRKKCLEDAQRFVDTLEGMGFRLVKKSEIVYLRRPTNPLRVRRRNADGSLEIVDTNRRR